ncbi:hypothetical protein JT358_09570 [Micrococcales bacterium 31B]|nr:hypothetical protein [Micrococcales bacterium 31B]
MGFINIQLDSRPSRNIMWRLWSSNLGKTFGNNPEITNNSSYSLATGVIAGTRLQNEYAQGHGSCVFSCGYNFSGTQTY